MIGMKYELMVIVLILLAAALLPNFLRVPTETKVLISNISTTEPQKIVIGQAPVIGRATIYIPAVDEEGNGVATTLKVEAKPGNGKVLVDINNLLFWIDTQYSIRTAQRVAQNITKIDVSNIDLIYTIEINATAIEGPSAGAALTIATIAALENKTLNTSVMITGTINPDGTIGPVGGIIPKAKAAKDVGATLFLVPEGQGTQVNYIPIRQCERIGPITYCTVEYKREKVDVIKEAGISVKEVSDINEALKYFLT
jgi:uncharacterized protein